MWSLTNIFGTFSFSSVRVKAHCKCYIKIKDIVYFYLIIDFSFEFFPKAYLSVTFLLYSLVLVSTFMPGLWYVIECRHLLLLLLPRTQLSVDL